MFGYTLVALGLEFVVWFVPDLIGTAVSVSIMGLCLGEAHICSKVIIVVKAHSVGTTRRTHVPHYALGGEQGHPPTLGSGCHLLDREVRAGL